MPYDGAFSAEEVGSRSGLKSPFGAGQKPPESEGERVTLTPHDHAFLESPPNYEVAASLPPPDPRPAPPPPSFARRAGSLLLFVAITGGAVAVLGMAVARYLGQALFGG